VPRLLFKVMEGIAMARTTIGITNLRPKKADDRVADGGGLYKGMALWDDRHRVSMDRCSVTDQREEPSGRAPNGSFPQLPVRDRFHR
jgi:hypothetical protein